MKKVYVSDLDSKFKELDDVVKKYDIVKTIEESTDVIIVPGGMSAFSDIFEATKLNKNVFLYNRDLYFSGLTDNLYKGHLEGYIEGVPSTYMHIESDINDLVKDMEEDYDKFNNGKGR